jgi:hypothetical protein
MNGAANLVASERGDHALDLPPVAEAHDITGVAADVRARRRLIPGVVAELLEQLCGVGQCRPPSDEGCVHGTVINMGPVTRLPTKVVNAALTMSLRFMAGAARAALAWRGMAKRNAQAGGIFLTLGILAGAGAGIAAGDPMKGVLIGTALGAGAALLLWLIDRRR